VIYTRDAAGVATIYVDGTVQASGTVGGDLSNWNGGYRLALANELTGNRPWLGELHLVAVFDRALSAAEVSQNYNAGPEGSGGAGGNQIPIANAGLDQIVGEGSVVTLDGTTSSDADGTIVIYNWMQTAGPIVTLNDAFTATPSFTAPSVSADTVLSFELTVTDNDGGIATDNVIVTTQNVNQLPIANAGVAQIVTEGSIISLTWSN